MKNSSTIQEEEISATNGTETGLETAEFPLEIYGTPEDVAERDEVWPAMELVAERFPSLDEQEVIFTFFAPEAHAVHVAGEFNSWSSDAAPLENTGSGEWVTRLQLRSGQYEYRFVVDGRWFEDPESAQRVVNPYDGFNSVLTVPLSVRTSLL
jgi:hypothetical protein